MGIGGIMTEIMRDVAFRMLPIGISDAKSMACMSCKAQSYSKVSVDQNQ